MGITQTRAILGGTVLVVILSCSGPAGTTGQASAGLLSATDSGGGDESPSTTSNQSQGLSPASYVNGSFQVAPGNGFGFVIGGGDASPWLVGTDNNVWHYNNDYSLSRTWLQEPNSANTNSLTVAPEGTPWKVDSSGNVAKRTGSGLWTPIGSGFLAYEIGVGAGDRAYAISRTCSNDDCLIYLWNGRRWTQTSGAARHVAVAPDGTAYVSNHYGTLFKWNGASWATWPGVGCVRNSSNGDHLGWPVIGAADNDAVWVLGCTGDGAGNGSIYAWHTQGSFWEQVPGAASTLSVTADGTPWVINSGTNIFEYTSTWQAIGPAGFSFDYQGVSEIWTGEVRDVDAAASGTVSVAALSGGVWRHPFSWVPISDVGAGVGARPGPVNSVATVASKPNNDKVVIVGTGVFDPRLNGPNGTGNGAWHTSDAGAATVIWSQSSFFDYQNQPLQQPPPTIVKVRYSADSTKAYLLTPQALFVSTDDGHSFYQQSTTCIPLGSDVFTDLAVDPNNGNYAYIGVTGEGVYQYNAATGCVASNPAPPLGQGTASSITYVALAMAPTGSRLYAAFAGQVFQGGDDFENIDTTTTATWPNWVPAVPESQFAQCNPNPPPSCNPDYNTCTPTTCCCPWGLQSQGGHDWALGTDPSGTIVLLGGVGLWRGTGCGANPCSSFTQINPYSFPVATPDHHDYHAITWGAASGSFYLVNDGGIFSSSDGGQTWSDQINSLLGVCDEMGVGVNGNNVFSAAWDVGAQVSANGGASWVGDDSGAFSTDARQAIADLNHAGYGYTCLAPSSGSNTRGFWDGTQWAENDNNIPQNNPCNMASSFSGSLFTIDVQNGQHVFQSSNQGQTWYDYGDPLPETVVSLVASNEFPASVYAVSVLNNLVVCNQCGSTGSWGLPITMSGSPGPWPGGYTFANPGNNAGNAIATDWLTSDFYAVGVDSTSSAQNKNARVVESPQSAHGASWTLLTGTVPQGTPGVAGMLKQDEVVQTILIDSSSRTPLVGTDGTAPASSIYGAATVWRLNNASVSDAYHHWRPWVNGLPIGTQDINWLTGQYENGVFYVYAAVWGRGIWKREARGGDL